MSDVNKNLGHATAYGYAKSKGYTGTEDEFATLMASYADVAEQARESAEDSEAWAVGERDGVPVPDTDAQYHNNSKYYAEKASTSAGESSDSADASGSSALVSEGHATGSQDGEPVQEGSPYYHNNALYYSQMSAQSADDADDYKTDAETAKTNAETARSGAEIAEGNAEAWAVGTKDSIPVPDTDPQYQNNAKYYAEQAQDAADASAAMTGLANQFDSTTAYAIGDYVLYDGTLYQFTVSHPAGAWTGTDAVPSVLSDGVSDLKSHISNATNVEALPVEPLMYVNGSGSTVTMVNGYPSASVSPNSNLSIVPCQFGDVFTINVTGGVSARGYIFIDSAGTILDKCGESKTFSDFELIAPPRSAFLIINNNISNQNKSYKGRLLYKAVDNIVDDTYKFTGNKRLININRLYYINASGSSVTMDNGYPAILHDNGTEVIIEACQAGDVFTVNALGGVTSRAFAFIDSAGSILLKAGESKDLINYVVTAPENSAFLIINNKDLVSGRQSYKGRYLINIVDDLKAVGALSNREISLSAINTMKGIAHRGYMAVAPENTEAAFKAAAEAGFVTIETDIRLTSDHVPVLIHDATVDRTSNGTGNVADKTLAQLKALDFGSWFGSAFAGEKILTLEEGVALCKKLNLRMLLENKTSAGATTYVTTIADIVKRCDYAENVMVMYDVASQLANFSGDTTLKNVPLVLLQNDIDENLTARIELLKAVTDKVYVAINYLNLTASKAVTILSNGAKIIVWTVEDENYIKSMDEGISGVLSGSYNAPVVIYNDTV